MCDSRLPWINVVIITVGRSDVVLDCLDDLEAQDYERFDVTVVDQNPTLDDRLLEREADSDGRLQVLQLIPAHMCAARNLGISRTSGEILVFVDDDTRFGPGLLSSYSKAFSSAKTGGVAGWIDADSPSDVWRPETTTVRTAIGCNMAYRRDVIEEVGGWDSNLVAPYFHGEETEFASRVTAAGYDIVVCSAALVFHRRFVTGGVRPQKSPDYWYSYITNLSLVFRKTRPFWMGVLTPVWIVKSWFTARRLAGRMITIAGFARAVLRGFSLARSSLATRSFLDIRATADSE